MSNWSTVSIFWGVLAIRLINSFTIQTFFQPDEFFQSLEPAHKLVFGYGYITWEWKNGLRSSIHPLLYAMGYKMASYLPDNHAVIVAIPKIIGAFAAAIGETHIYIFALKYSNNPLVAKFTLVLSLLNPFNWYVITRSFSNSLEMVLTSIALAYWPWRSKDCFRLLPSCFFAFISCIIRPTNSVIWLVLGTYFICILSMAQAVKLVIQLSLELGVVLGISFILDRLFYGYWTFPLYNFVEFNIIKNLSIFYGLSPWHFHIFQSVPLLLMTYLPLFVVSIVKYKLYKTVLGVVVAFTLLLFSVIDHKEFRFIYPLMPIFLLFSAFSFKDIYLRSKYFYLVVICITIINSMVAVLFNNVNERGEIDIISYLRTNAEVIDFGFLTPCHSTPWQSHLHDSKFETSWFITCEPPLHLEKANFEVIKSYRDESDQLFDNPELFIQDNFPPTLDYSASKYSWPTHLIIYDNFHEMAVLLQQKGYFECHRVFNSYFHWDDRRRGDLVVYCKP